MVLGLNQVHMKVTASDREQSRYFSPSLHIRDTTHELNGSPFVLKYSFDGVISLFSK